MKTNNVHFFGNGQIEGSADMKNLLGGKGANLAEMTSIGLLVPHGFAISSEVCTQLFKNDSCDYQKYLSGFPREVPVNLKVTNWLMKMNKLDHLTAPDNGGDMENFEGAKSTNVHNHNVLRKLFCKKGEEGAMRTLKNMIVALSFITVFLGESEYLLGQIHRNVEILSEILVDLRQLLEIMS